MTLTEPGEPGWLETRLPIRRVWTAFVSERIPGGARWAYVFGSLCLALCAVQFLTGVAIALVYVPMPGAALASLSYFSSSVAGGRIVLGIHHWCANILVCVILFHAAQTFVYGAYKTPRELVWLSGVVLLLMVQGFHFTGFVLPWDQKGYWATEVGTSIIGTTPLVGNLLKRVVRGGEELGALTLTHFYAVHVLLLPALTLIGVALHLVCMRRVGPAGSWGPARPAHEGQSFYPDQVLKDLFVVALVVAAIVCLAAVDFVPPTSAADPTDTSVLPRPEWNFLFLFQLQRYFPGSLEWVGTMGVPGMLVLLMVAVPFLDRRAERSPVRRLGTLLAGVTVAGTVAALTLTAVWSDAATWAYLTRPAVRVGARLYAENECAGCHKIRGDGAVSAPDLSFIGQVRDVGWLKTYIRDPDSLNSASTMPPYRRLNEREIEALATYLKSLQ